MLALIEEALLLIKPNMSISLGGGSNVAKLAAELAKHKNLHLTICTPSEVTQNYCKSIGIPITSFNQASHFDIAFDGCDSLDSNLNALKSNGGIHLSEKVSAELADEYVILAPLQRVTKILSPDIPLTLEIDEKVIGPIQKQLNELKLRSKIRMSNDIAGYVRTASGNLLIDCYADNWGNISFLNDSLAKLNGVIATSFFENLVTLALTFDTDGKIHKFERKIDYDKI